jgi:hypothetical protein
MASKKTKPPQADDNLDELFSGIGDDSKAKKPSAATSKSSKAPASKGKDDDLLADLESELASQQPSSRPHTPRLREAGGKRSTATPPAVDDKSTIVGRKSTDSARSLRASFTPSATSSELHESERKGTVEQSQQAQPAAGGDAGAAGGSWWGGFISTANAAMKQAEAAYKEIQHNEEAKKWADQVKGLRNIDVGALKSYGKLHSVSPMSDSRVS